MAVSVGIVGATGAVGQELIRLLHERNFPFSSLKVLASGRSAGKEIRYKDETFIIEEATPESFDRMDIALFSAGATITKTLAPEAAKRGCVVVDNSSAFRMDPDVPLVVPEINPEAVRDHKGIIANPNCSTAIALMGLAPLHQAFGLKRFVACTYQAVSGSGVAGMQELENQIKAWSEGKDCPPETYPHPIAFNLFPHVDVFFDDGYTKEEHKMLNESRKIMSMPDLPATTTCVRVPVMRAHSIAIHAEFEQPVSLEAAREAIAAFSGAELCDDTANNVYPTPLQFSGKNKCGVGRIRIDSALDNGLAFFVVGDQLLKGAALNAVQIAEEVVRLQA
ncbi:aspartate-semialdehyde dehydrogenase [Puniceicoccales bacterium CK1056]|uniref:Aspartate-semialdehyde dehydrogenase n=1 Tax=Oceanipulchritudo coccoides TaxID=2706888 RepID=A0A6B2LXX6_9BACT|nr:aspartate-semialdehyde dehydrogenase [Oceanipulchritudo coccoides]NDV60962.1 aspartate-semialdehyde dehydrogenase [Oceanipulchritudo coccoides]